MAAFCVPYSPNGGGVVLPHRLFDAGAVTPDRPAMDQVPAASAQCLHQRGRRVGGEADHVHHHLRLELGDSFPERPGRVLGCSVHRDLLDLGPRFVIDVESEHRGPG